MDYHFWTAFAASVLAACVTTAGICAIRRFEAWGRRNTTYWACFAAGALISVSFLHIIPTSFSMAAHAPVYLLAGYLFVHVFNRFITAYVCDRPTTAEYAIGLVPLLGIGFHSFIDGMIYSVTFSVSIFTGVLAAIGMVLHEFPEGIVTYVLMVRAGFSDRKALAASDVRFLVQEWLDTPEYRETLLTLRFSHFGFAERVNGEGRKVALAALGVSR